MIKVVKIKEFVGIRIYRIQEFMERGLTDAKDHNI